MKNLLLSLVAAAMPMLLSAQSITAARVSVSEEVVFEKLLMPGASAQSLAIYSPYAADKRSEFYFEKAQIAGLGKCIYHLSCEGGKVISVRLDSRESTGTDAIETIASGRFGAPQREMIEKEKGEEARYHYVYQSGEGHGDLRVQKNHGWQFSAGGKR